MWLDELKKKKHNLPAYFSWNDIHIHFDRLIEIVVRCEQGGACWPTQFSSVPCCPICSGRKELLGGHNYDTFRYGPVEHKPSCPYSGSYGEE